MKKTRDWLIFEQLCNSMQPLCYGLPGWRRCKDVTKCIGLDIDCAEFADLLSHCFQEVSVHGHHLWMNVLRSVKHVLKNVKNFSHGDIAENAQKFAGMCWRMQRYGLNRRTWKLSWFKTKWNTKSNIVFWCSFWYSKPPDKSIFTSLLNVISNTSIKIMLGFFVFCINQCFNVGIPFFSRLKPERMYKATQEWSYNHPFSAEIIAKPIVLLNECCMLKRKEGARWSAEKLLMQWQVSQYEKARCCWQQFFFFP